jgi:isopropylmalate/homocitrate/citramalate synthase
MPERIEIHDVTLRDGEQQAGVEFSADDKIRIAEALAEAGVHRIEAGLPAVSKEDEGAVRAIAARGLPSTIYAFSRCMVDDVKRAADCGVAGVVMEIPSSRHLIELGYRWTVERALDLSIEATQYAHEQGLLISFFPIDATRATGGEYLELVGKVAREGHVDALGLVDTFGVLTPHAVERFVSSSRDALGVPLETHFHMDFGLGVANSLIAVGAGASVIQTTVGGIGERAGNTPLEETVLALLTLYGVDLGIVTEKLTPLARLVMDLAGVSQPSNRPVTGPRLYSVESGIIATWVRNVRDVDLTEAFPYLPGLVGQTGPRLVLGKGSGLDSVAEWLGDMGISATEAEMLEILGGVKDASLAKRDLLDMDEFKRIVLSVIPPEEPLASGA